MEIFYVIDYLYIIIVFIKKNTYAETTINTCIANKKFSLD
jgi:hypothetical protein